MSAPPMETLLDRSGRSQTLGGYVVAAAFDHAGNAGFALGDGTLHIAPADGGEWRAAEVADGGLLCLAPDAAPAGFLCGGDDGSFTRVSPEAVAAPIAHYSKWVERIASVRTGKEAVVACAAGRAVHLFTPAGEALKSLEHPSTVTGLAFDHRGKRIAASHYNAVSLWFVASSSAAPRRLEWKGSHIGLAMHPAGEAVVTAMQENELHGWRLADGQHMRMSGYPAKTESLSFSHTGKWLASSGADAIVLWPFFGGGPMGKAPTELAGGREVLCTRVACHPSQDICAAGYSDGLVILADLGTQRLIPAAAPAGAEVTALAWNDSGTQLAFGTAAGRAGVIDLRGK